MTKIHNIFLLRTRRKPNVCQIDTVAFDALHEEKSPEKCRQQIESSINEKFSPYTLNTMQQYEKYPKESQNGNNSKSCIILALLFIAVFFLLPIAYLSNCFGFIYTHVKPDDTFINQSYKVNLQFTDYSKENTISSMKLASPPKAEPMQCLILKDEEKLDCFPQGTATSENCQERGCCWQPRSSASNIPFCFYPNGFPTYNYVNVTRTAFGLIAFLKRDYNSSYPEDVGLIEMIVKYETETRLHIKFIDPLQRRYEPRFPELPIVDKAASNLQYELLLDPIKRGFQVLRKDDGTVIFDALEFRNMIFSNQFLQLSGKLPSNYIYGIGERYGNIRVDTNWKTTTLFNHDEIPQFGKNLYGSHPYYLVIENSTKSHGVFLLNSNAMDILVQPTPIVTYRSIGGLLDFFFFLGPTPKEVTAQYTELIGRPHMPPYWGLGFHLCRFGYKTLNETRRIMQRNIDAGIPLDTQWNDLDYMDNSNDFTYDKKAFRNLPEFVDELHTRGMHYIPLVDPGVSASESPGSYLPYDEGVKENIFVKNSSGGIFIGKVWNRATTVWPDFTNPKTVDYWTMMLKNLHKEIKYDGLWIDMNEPSNFYSGAANGCPKNELEHPMYVPNVDGGYLYYKTMCMTCQHYASSHYDVHNLYGFTEAIITNFALAEVRGKRPMIISRSTFPGHGRYAGHWTGDVWSKWSDMYYSIPQILSFSLFGIPLVGADICGFNGNSTSELCNRWMQLGAFYPFARNHNTDDGIDQDPVAFGDLVIKSSKKALEARYSLLPFLYTLFWYAHTEGQTVARPLFVEFPNDRNTYGIDKQFLWGPSLMIIPVLEDNVDMVRGYLPKGVWYDFYSKVATKSEGQYFNISAPLDTIPLFFRSGFIIPRQSPKQTTTESRKSPIDLLVALDEGKSAYGQLYWDDGDSLNPYQEKLYSLTNFTSNENLLKITNIYRDKLPPNLGNIDVLGVDTTVTSVYINGQKHASFKYYPVEKILKILEVNTNFLRDISITWY